MKRAGLMCLAVSINTPLCPKELTIIFSSLITHIAQELIPSVAGHCLRGTLSAYSGTSAAQHLCFKTRSPPPPQTSQNQINSTLRGPKPHFLSLCHVSGDLHLHTWLWGSHQFASCQKPTYFSGTVHCALQRLCSLARLPLRAAARGDFPSRDWVRA